MAASETGFSPSRDICTRRRCLPLTAERPKRHGHARLAHRSTLLVGVMQGPWTPRCYCTVADLLRVIASHFITRVASRCVNTSRSPWRGRQSCTVAVRRGTPDRHTSP